VSTPRLLTLMGSGETAPTMTKVHRDLIDRLGTDVPAVVLDTPYGFQENAPELAARAIEYFRASVQRPIEVAGLQRLHGDVDALTRERGLARLRSAQYVFAGPGSPSYALRQWAGTAVPAILTEKLRSGGAITFASAAALTLGRFSVPVYEIYKVGDDPSWADGLDVLSTIGLDVVVIPHYDNAEGGHHDTRFCYLGERRLAMLERMLPEGVHVIGVDEHTGVVLDLDADTATVVGNGTLTVRVGGRSTSHPSGSILPIDLLRHPHAGPAGMAARGSATTSGTDGSAITDAGQSTSVRVAEVVATSLAQETASCRSAFDEAMSSGDADGAARAALALEAAIAAWSADTLQSDETDRARGELRSMIVRLGEAAVVGFRDDRDVIGPFVEALLELRSIVRAEQRYELSDTIRDRLAEAGVEVRDDGDASTWRMRER
jgi:hypothetical protein